MDNDQILRSDFLSCMNCGYELSGSTGCACPECGWEMELSRRYASFRGARRFVHGFVRWCAVLCAAWVVLGASTIGLLASEKFLENEKAIQNAARIGMLGAIGLVFVSLLYLSRNERHEPEPRRVHRQRVLLRSTTAFGMAPVAFSLTPSWQWGFPAAILVLLAAMYPFLGIIRDIVARRRRSELVRQAKRLRVLVLVLLCAIGLMGFFRILEGPEFFGTGVGAGGAVFDLISGIVFVGGTILIVGIPTLCLRTRASLAGLIRESGLGPGKQPERD